MRVDGRSLIDRPLSVVTVTAPSVSASGRALTATPVDARRARWLLCVVVVATSAFAIRYYDGHDFINNVWVPIHGLLAGFNPYNPADLEYYLRYNVPVEAVFFFQAEDGIRDGRVTGVQTCALPI